MDIQKFLTKEDLAEISKIVKEAESQISGEIVPVITERCDSYNISAYRAGLFSSILAFIFLIISDRFIPSMAIYDPILYFTIVVFAGAFFALAAIFIPSFKRLFIGNDLLDQRTSDKAESAFLEYEIFNTTQRTGIMIFISLFERRVIIKTDKGIANQVDQSIWDDLVRDIVNALKNGNAKEALTLGIRRSAEIVKEKGFIISPDDKNELSNELRIE